MDSGVALELNTSGLIYPGAETYPSAATVQRFRDLGGTRVVAGSDAHRKESLAQRFDLAREILLDAGFEALAFRRGDAAASIPIALAA